MLAATHRPHPGPVASAQSFRTKTSDIASEAAKEALALRMFLADLGVCDGAPTSLASDNQAAIATAYNPEHHSRMKHVERRHFFVRECVENLHVVVPYVPTCDNLADFFTKRPRSQAFLRHA